MLPQEPCLHHILELRPQGLLSRQRGANRLHQANQVLDVQGNTGNASGMLLEYDGIWWIECEYYDWMQTLRINPKNIPNSNIYTWKNQHMFVGMMFESCLR